MLQYYKILPVLIRHAANLILYCPCPNGCIECRREKGLSSYIRKVEWSNILIYVVQAYFEVLAANIMKVWINILPELFLNPWISNSKAAITFQPRLFERPPNFFM